jgi:hypothetical protein
MSGGIHGLGGTGKSKTRTHEGNTEAGVTGCSKEVVI